MNTGTHVPQEEVKPGPRKGEERGTPVTTWARHGEYSRSRDVVRVTRDLASRARPRPPDGSRHSEEPRCRSEPLGRPSLRQKHSRLDPWPPALSLPYASCQRRLLCPARWLRRAPPQSPVAASHYYLAWRRLRRPTLGQKPPSMAHPQPVSAPAPSAFLGDAWSVPWPSGRPRLLNALVEFL